MPIRFRCAHCDQLMGIARRKAGTIVSCPTCEGQIIVPQPEPETVSSQSKNIGGMFEESDLSDVLEKQPNQVAPEDIQVNQSNMGQMVDFEEDAALGGMVLTTGKLILLAIIILMLLALAFFAGLLVGRSSVEQTETAGKSPSIESISVS